MDESKLFRLSGFTITMHFPKEADDYECSDIRNELQNILRKTRVRTIVVDVTETDFMDSAGIGIILNCCRIISRYKGELLIRGARAQVLRVLKISGLGSMVYEK